jgi:succinate dehydrogenase / fumarate reductase cytochrome b subunit
MSGFFNSSIGRKYAMALSAVFNDMSHFMGTNPLIQFAMQPVLIFGVIFHFIMGFVLELKNKGSRNVKYAKNNGGANSTWMSRNMIYSGLVILAFIVLHFIDFWIPEINTKYIQGDMSGVLAGEDSYRYFEELQHKFVEPWRVGAYVVAFVLLALHLLHGFTSAFQSIGATVGRQKTMKNIGKAYSILIPLGFIVIALFHHFNH